MAVDQARLEQTCDGSGWLTGDGADGAAIFKIPCPGCSHCKPKATDTYEVGTLGPNDPDLMDRAPKATPAPCEPGGSCRTCNGEEATTTTPNSDDYSRGHADGLRAARELNDGSHAPSVSEAEHRATERGALQADSAAPVRLNPTHRDFWQMGVGIERVEKLLLAHIGALLLDISNTLTELTSVVKTMAVEPRTPRYPR